MYYVQNFPVICTLCPIKIGWTLSLTVALSEVEGYLIYLVCLSCSFGLSPLWAGEYTFVYNANQWVK
jgi:hypothetical protein